MRRIWAVALAIWMATLAPALAGAAEFVEALGAQMASAPDRAATVAVLDQRFDLDAMAVAALPDAFRDKATRSYVIAYRDHLAQVFLHETLKVDNAAMRILGTRNSGALTLVGTELSSDAGRRMVEFYLRPEGAGFRVVNAAVEGLLVTAQQQKDFLPVLISGDMPGLIAFLTGADG